MQSALCDVQHDFPIKIVSSSHFTAGTFLCEPTSLGLFKGMRKRELMRKREQLIPLLGISRCMEEPKINATYRGELHRSLLRWERGRKMQCCRAVAKGDGVLWSSFATSETFMKGSDLHVANQAGSEHMSLYCIFASPVFHSAFRL